MEKILGKMIMTILGGFVFYYLLYTYLRHYFTGPVVYILHLFYEMNLHCDIDHRCRSDQYHIVIDQTCSGVRLFIVMVVLIFINKIDKIVSYKKIISFVFLAYILTLVANITRILISVSLLTIDSSFFHSDIVHEITGIITFFPFIVLLFYIVQRFTNVSSQ